MSKKYIMNEEKAKVLLNKITKLVLFCVIFTAIISSTITFFITKNSIGRYSFSSTKEVNIQVDDTLWSIAEEISSEDQDIRQIVYDIKQINSLKNSNNIYIGQTLDIPVYNN